jgi:hypothetical protein
MWKLESDMVDGYEFSLKSGCFVGRYGVLCYHDDFAVFGYYMVDLEA